MMDFGPYEVLASKKELAKMFPPGTTMRYEPDKVGVFRLQVYNT